MTNCKNCGAILKSSVCEYCGTVYNDDFRININIDKKQLLDSINKISVINKSQFYKLMEV